MTFRQLAARAADMAGHPKTFFAACALILVWGLLGPIFHFSDGWQLTVNTGTTIITFLMVFLLQASQNKDTKELHLKLAELIRATKDARNRFVYLEDASEEEMKKLKEQFKKLKEQ